MSILKKMKKKYYSINKHEWEQIKENKEREHTSRQLEILLQTLKKIGYENESNGRTIS